MVYRCNHHTCEMVCRCKMVYRCNHQYQLEWDVTVHPPYIPDIAHSDYYLFLHKAQSLIQQKSPYRRSIHFLSRDHRSSVRKDLTIAKTEWRLLFTLILSLYELILILKCNFKSENNFFTNLILFAFLSFSKKISNWNFHFISTLISRKIGKSNLNIIFTS